MFFDSSTWRLFSQICVAALFHKSFGEDSIPTHFGVEKKMFCEQNGWRETQPTKLPYLVGGFKYLLFSPLLGEMIKFD